MLQNTGTSGSGPQQLEAEAGLLAVAASNCRQVSCVSEIVKQVLALQILLDIQCQVTQKPIEKAAQCCFTISVLSVSAGVHTLCVFCASLHLNFALCARARIRNIVQYRFNLLIHYTSPSPFCCLLLPVSCDPGIQPVCGIYKLA